MKEFNTWSPTKQKVFNWSIAVGHKTSEYKSRNEKMPPGLKLKSKIADKLVLSKLRQIFGSKMRTMPCSGAAIRPELLRFFHATGLFINYGYGATETTATVACMRTDVYNFDSCGSIMPGIEVRISDKGEIQVKGRTVFSGYYNKPEATEKALVDGWYHTGDEGNLMGDGMLSMSDRINDLFKTSVGKFVSPQKVELLVGQNKFVEQVIVFGDNRKYITALIVPSEENLTWETKRMGLRSNKLSELVNDPAVQELFEKELEKTQESLAPYEKIIRFTLLDEPFSVENNALTSTLKVRRKIIRSIYQDTIEAMYGSS